MNSNTSLAGSQSPGGQLTNSPSSYSPTSGPRGEGSPASNGSRSAERGMDTSDQTTEKRVPLACHRCRAKRGRCTGEKPICGACAKARAECTWPEGRRRKRTRKEMEMAERLEAETSGMRSRRPAESRSTSVLTSADNQQNDNRASYWHMSAPPSHRISPANDTSSSSDHWRISPPSNPTRSHLQTQGHSNSWNDTISSPPSNPSGTSNLQYSSQQTFEPMDHGLDSFAPAPAALSRPSSIPQGETNDTTAHMDLELYYYRFSGQSGSTAIHPGINRISLRLQSRPSAPTLPDNRPIPPVPHRSSSNITSSISPSAPLPAAQPSLNNNPDHQIFDEHGSPLPEYYGPLMETFFTTLGPHFPSVSKRRMEERIETRTMSAFFLNCICAISARFHESGRDDPAKACAPYITKAQELIVPLLHLPTNDVCTGLLLLAWACYGQNSESGLWQYSGMAIRMALDLGLHEISEIYESSSHVIRTRCLFWSIYMTDRILAFYTGRPPTIPDDIIEIPLPTDGDFFPDPARDTDAAAFSEPSEPVPYYFTVRLMVICGRIAAVLNGRRGRARTLVGMEKQSGDNGRSVLNELQRELVQFYSELPIEMKWSAEAFKRQDARGYGGTFLLLHLWANAVMALTYHPELTTGSLGTETPLTQNMERSVKLSLSCSRTVSECVVIADLFGSRSYLASPFCVQPIFIASLAFIHDIKTSGLGHHLTSGHNHNDQLAQQVHLLPEPPTADSLLQSFARQSLTTLTSALQKMDHYWAGIAYVTGIMEMKTRSAGVVMLRENAGFATGAASSTPEANSRTKRTFITLPDQGLLHRFTNPNLPHNTGPATETSLRSAMAKEALEQAQQMQDYSLDELLSSYSIEDFLVQPAGMFDLEQLLSL
ncbi:uncharacterized protein STEHIDRAFT_147598 [Stereum hirsutum FP-91666 SS1]|uniref:uncharacterized protein n=1 Tax=Stereum hirsutum (strain FP-91666) TaxID=721885 RepID=UPI00044493A2|nr:uncharacterized protein STEHIDRAFT_147598 [Stereum hirsutum FP-91666 SS1]EIM86073.1 hypothetical protein STEHIDRAFT_147598 [Stereum hirsutum FP-91666 SS1]